MVLPGTENENDMNADQTFDQRENEIHDDLQAHHARAFALVENKTDWKAPIDAFITTDEVRAVCEAIAFFTATTATVEYIGFIGEPVTLDDWKRFKVGDHICRVRSVGYRRGPAGC